MQEIGRRSGMRKRMGKRKGGGRGRIYNWEQREREEKNEKERYFLSCEKKNNNKNILKNRIVK